MAEITLNAVFSTVPSGEAEELKRVLLESIEQIAQEEGSFKTAKVVFTESDERCVLTADLDGTRREPNPLQLDLDLLDDAKTGAGARAQLKEEIRTYFRKVQGR